MYKMIFGAKRKPAMPMDKFQAYWLGPHADKARQVPGIKRYVINLLADLGGSGRELPYDGIAETWFENEEDMRLSGRSPELKVVLADEANLFDLGTRWSVIVQENLMIDDGEPVGYRNR
jgi:uncharacterized protein (TIGR02118 family)